MGLQERDQATSLSGEEARRASVCLYGSGARAGAAALGLPCARGRLALDHQGIHAGKQLAAADGELGRSLTSLLAPWRERLSRPRQSSVRGEARILSFRLGHHEAAYFSRF